MSWVLVVLIAYHILGGLIVVGYVGKHRDPITPGTAVFSLLIQALVIAATLYVAR